MSKNVAVFVDVANIFYAAKAAGVDIDYVTLLRSASVNRDLVRAYAYTGLDPENENQRQFHSFLARSGYKVVSKDIRKYGDGRIKANLDIELVVDMMRMADHIDIAVVVSGDGDFAPAIRAVQQMGVRVEVICFRGNTSSDLMDVADVFTDIAHIARVEKGARSGRRVAADDDLSMTEVPDKEAGVTPRRRRSTATRHGGEERREREPELAAASASGAEVVALPGERLSRVKVVPAVTTSDRDGELDGADDGSEQVEGPDGDGRRRRRRRGGRGRGRGGQLEEAATLPQAVDEPDDLLEEEVLPLPQHSTFGSVWDSQMGVPSTTSRALDDVEGLDDEPEIPEYLLAERRQQSRRRGGRGRGGRPGTYQSAVDRERYGRTGFSPAPSAPSGRRPDLRGGNRPPQPQPQRSRPPTATTMSREPQGGAQPWSEVPLEVQELLRAEIERRQVSGRPSTAATSPADGGQTRGRRAPRPAARAAVPEAVASATVEPAVEPEAKPKARRTTRAKQAAPEAVASATVEPAVEPEAKPKARRTTRAKQAAPEAVASATVEPAVEPEAKPKARRTTRAKQAAPEA